MEKRKGYSINPEDYLEEIEAINWYCHFGINLKNPVTLRDKLFWLNIYEPDILKSRCADKVLLRDYCKEKLGFDLCIPIIKVYTKPEEINFDELPNRFIIKCNHGSSMNIKVTDKSIINKEEIINQLREWQKIDYAFNKVCFEFHYHDIEKKIIIEEYREDSSGELKDYKFSCFNGVPKMVCAICNLFTKDETTNYYDMDFNLLDYSLVYHPANKNVHFEKPKNFDKMIEYATKLSQDFKYVRVDFFNVDGTIYLSELTFTPHALFYLRFKNPEDEIKLGNMLKI